jgi:DNA-binding SARP family transcriptional activator/tetratricopeptide (TPR) repeat protein
MNVSFGLLGSPEMIQGSEPVPITGGRQRVILTVLLLEAGRLIPVQRLVDSLWPEEPPATARSQVHICISSLRKLLARSAAELVTRPGGYMLEIPDGSLDLSRFRDLVAEAGEMARQHPAEAVKCYREGLELWRGDACAGVASKVVEYAATRLNEERWAALETCLDLELQLGLHHRVVGELAELAAAKPFWERLRAMLMLALYRCGRQAEALEVSRIGRRIMVEELGTDPGKELQALEQAILTGDNALDLLPSGRATPTEVTSEARLLPKPRQLPATIMDFVGRQDLLRSMRAALDPTARTTAHDQPSYMATVVLTGRGGIGKTTLALRLAHAINASFPDGQLFARLREAEGQAGSPASILEHFLRSLGVPPALIPEGTPQRTAMLRSVLAERKLLILLDDAVSVNQVEPLLPGGSGCGVIITSRVRLVGLAGAKRFEVGVFDDQAAVELLTHVVGAERTDAEPKAVRELVELCEGLPLALRIAASKLGARTHWKVARMVERLGDERQRLDELDLEGASVRAALEFAYGGLSDSGRKLLERLSLVDQADFPSWVGAALIDTTPTLVENVLEDLEDARLIEARANDDGTIRYHLHDMVRLFGRERIAETESPADRRVVIRRYVGCWLKLVSDAHRRYYGGDFHVVHGHETGWPLPSHVADSLLANPIIWLHQERDALVRAIMLASRAQLDELCWDLAVTSVTLFELGSYEEDWRQTHDAALTATTRVGNDRGTAALMHSLGFRSISRDLGQARDYIHRSLDLWERLGDSHGRAFALTALATADRLSGDLNAAESGYQEALRFFEDARDLVGQASALRGLGQVAIERERYKSAGDLLERSVTITQGIGAKRDAVQSMYYLAELHRRRDELDRAEELLSQATRETHAAGDIVGEGYSLLGLGVLLIQNGDFSRADRELRSAEALSVQSGDVLLRSQILLARAELELAVGK